MFSRRQNVGRNVWNDSFCTTPDGFPLCQINLITTSGPTKLPTKNPSLSPTKSPAVSSTSIVSTLNPSSSSPTLSPVNGFGPSQSPIIFNDDEDTDTTGDETAELISTGVFASLFTLILTILVLRVIFHVKVTRDLVAVKDRFYEI